MNSIRSSSRAISLLMRVLILASHASFAPFVLYERIILFLSGHLYKISQQSHSYTLSQLSQLSQVSQIGNMAAQFKTGSTSVCQLVQCRGKHSCSTDSSTPAAQCLLRLADQCYPAPLHNAPLATVRHAGY
jgi:hypothetical protein